MNNLLVDEQNLPGTRKGAPVPFAFWVREGPSDGVNDFGIELCSRFWQAAEKR